jgi:hypothetical protein
MKYAEGAPTKPLPLRPCGFEFPDEDREESFQKDTDLPFVTSIARPDKVSSPRASCSKSRQFSHVRDGVDPTDPPRSEPFPYPAVPHEPYISRTLKHDFRMVSR